MGEGMIYEDKFHQILIAIEEVIERHKFPDGCLDLDTSQQDLFARDLAERIITKIMKGK